TFSKTFIIISLIIILDWNNDTYWINGKEDVGNTPLPWPNLGRSSATLAGPWPKLSYLGRTLAEPWEYAPKLISALGANDKGKTGKRSHFVFAKAEEGAGEKGKLIDKHIGVKPVERFPGFWWCTLASLFWVTRFTKPLESMLIIYF
ncbi:hypothetical protein EV360DRAFT_75168, partial [Lentinula raphanica]